MSQSSRNPGLWPEVRRRIYWRDVAIGSAGALAGSVLADSSRWVMHIVLFLGFGALLLFIQALLATWSYLGWDKIKIDPD